jgi:serine/threonine protein kinase
VPPAAAQSIESADYPRVGETVGNLLIIESIASGGMAHVFKAQHRHLEVFRAVKILKPGSRPENLSRFFTEAKLAASLQHPNIVHIYNVDMWKGVLPYIEMELVNGRSVQQIIATQGKLPPAVALAITRIVCDALHFAGEQDITVYGKQYRGLVHRDIKPANILIDKQGVVKLVDFGIALPEGKSLHTTVPGMLGTFPYASPEQIEAHPLDARTDIYSLGCVLYELLSGKKAFGQSTLTELIHRKQHGKYSPLYSMVADIPESVIELVDRCLQVNRQRRFEGPAQLREALDTVLRTLSNESAYALVQSYICQGSTKQIPHIPTPKRNIFKSSFAPYVLSAAALFITMGVLVWGASRFLDKKQSPPTTMVSSPAIASPPPAQTTQLPTAQPSSTGTDGGAVVAAKDNNAPPTLERQGLAAFSRGNYLNARDLLQKARSQGLSKRAALRLFECYVQTNQLDQAAQWADSAAIDDGWFHLLAARTWIARREYERADKALIQASATPTILSEPLPKQISLLTARLRDRQYLIKPNSINRQQAFTAWQHFQGNYCTQSNSKLCTEASERVKQLAD